MYIGSKRALLEGAPYDVDAVAWARAVVNAGATITPARRRLVGQLIHGLKNDGVWAILDRLWLFAAENATQAGIDLVARASIVDPATTGNPTFTANQGYTGNGSTSYIDTGYNVSTGAKFVRDSAHYAVCHRTASSTSAVADGLFDASINGDLLDWAPGASASSARINTNAQVIFTVTAQGLGTVVASRTAANLANLYYNGGAAIMGAGASLAPPNLNFFLGACNNNGGLYRPHDAQICWASFGSGLPDAQAASLYTNLTAYRTVVGA